ncbi:MAG TPA: hypothetical protein VGD27_15320 [Longimicrobiales bacterium]
MPSEDRMLAALQSLTQERDAFRSALAAALEQVRGIMATGNHVESTIERAALELGAFASGRIQLERFADIARHDDRPKKSELASIRHAQQLLAATLAMGDQLHTVDVPENGDLYAIVQEALATAGRAFAAAYAIELIRTNRELHTKEEALLAPLPPERWTRAERELAPPLVVRVHGGDLRLSGFEELLQGAQKIVLLVDGHAPPAALARLISPNVFVMQCRSLEDLKRVRDYEGPAIAAVINEPAAAFVWNRGTLTVDYLPSELPKRPLRTSTVFRQQEDLAWLQTVQRYQQQSVVEVAATSPETITQPGDKLAAWLLRQVELPQP